MSIRDNYMRALERVAAAASASGRDTSEIKVIAVTKTHGPETVREAIEAGVTDVGENRVQEFLEKADKVGLPCRWHLIGHLQSNKVNKAIGRFAMIQSVDSFRLAEKLSDAGQKEGIVTDVLLEVNTSGEGSKFGALPEEAADLCGRIGALPALRIRGLMTVGPWMDDLSRITQSFRTLRRLFETIESQKIDNVKMEHLSMGMTDDFESAIAEGSTMVRLGRAIFGPRQSY